MFNAPRPGPAQRYTAGSGGGLGGSFVDANPLAGPESSVYDSFDPWSNHNTPSPPSPISQSQPTSSNQSVFSNVIADATVPGVYHRSFNAVDPDSSGEISVNSLSRVLGTSSLPASTIDRIVNLVSSRPRVSKLEFFVALALVALAQSGKDVSIEQVAALSSQNTLPEPSLDLDRLQPSISTLKPPSSSNLPRSPAPAYAEDPWNSRFGSNGNTPAVSAAVADPFAATVNGATSTIAGTGLPKEWWRKQHTAHVSISGQQGFILNRYTVYQITTERGSVTRRYSEFVYLWDCLTKRYPFRLFPALPPKRIGPDEYFLEQRRRGLSRSLAFVINHPIMKEDSLLSVFLTVPSFEQYRKQATISLDEESASKRVDRVEEMAIPSDLEEKLTFVRQKINPLIEQWQRICVLAERIIKRREAAAVRTPLHFRPSDNPAHFAFFPISPSSASFVSSSASSSTSNRVVAPILRTPFDSAYSILISGSSVDDDQGDLARLTNTLRAVTEVNSTCWRGEGCELDGGVRAGLEQVAAHTQRHAEITELRVRSLLDNTLEGLKRQRDLYMAMRDLYIRHDRFSVDQVERLKKRIETNSTKMESVKAAAKDGWQDQVENLISSIEKDQATIAAQMQRRVFIRACLWHELRVILHNRENTLLTEIVQNFAKDERDFVENVASNWISLGEAVENMPME